jgi:hypothetical protein
LAVLLLGVLGLSHCSVQQQQVVEGCLAVLLVLQGGLGMIGSLGV